MVVMDRIDEFLCSKDDDALLLLNKLEARRVQMIYPITNLDKQYILLFNSFCSHFSEEQKSHRNNKFLKNPGPYPRKTW